MTVAVLTVVLALVAVVAISIIVIRRRLYAQALLALAFIGAVVSAVWGFVKLADDVVENETAGAIMVGWGLTIILLASVAIRRLYYSRPPEARQPDKAD